MPPMKSKELRSFRIDETLLKRLDNLCDATGAKKVDVVETALERELTRRERMARKQAKDKGGSDE